ncbi:MAG TPA: methyltransferase domain-containing protein [Anaeromyxobacter sp.]
MSLAREYRRQLEWRDWPRVLDALPSLGGQLVLDLGCAVGDQAAALAARGARVIGVDLNEELLAEARSRSIDGAEFRLLDLRTLPDLGVVADGIWSSLAAAYFPDLPRVLRSWARHLRPGGWIALTEIDDLWAHEPLGAEARAVLDAYAREALEAGRYDFRMGRKLATSLEACGFTVTRTMTLEDRELSFAGPAPPEILDAWRARLDRLKPLQELCGARFEDVRADYLRCLAHPDHRCGATVLCCIATRGERDRPPAP